MDDFALTLPDAAAAAAWLDRVTPHIAADDALPALGCVQITVADGYLLAVATDRYTLAVSRIDAPTGTVRGTFLVSGEWARVAARVFDCESCDATTLTLTGRRVTLAAECCGAVTRPVPDLGGAWWPEWRALLASSLDHPPADRPATVAAEYLTRFSPYTSVGLDADGAVSLADTAAPIPYTVHVPADHRPVVLLSRDLLGIIAVQRTDRPQQTTDSDAGTDMRALWAPVLETREQVPA